MAKPSFDAKTSRVITSDIPSANLTPTTTCNEKGAAATSMELSRNSNVSTPSSAHHFNPFDTDVEAMGQSSEALNSKSPSGQLKTKKQDCPVWPGQEHWKKKTRAAKINKRSCQILARLEPRTRVIVKILIALLIIGIAIGVGVGISKPLGAPIWKSSNATN